MKPTAQNPVLILITENIVKKSAPVSKTFVILLQDANMLPEVISLLYIFKHQTMHRLLY